jgi:hypothetical protein
VIAFDPGTTTGWATGVISGGRLEVLDYGYAQWKEVALTYDRRQRQDPALDLSLVKTPPFDVMVYESFYLRKSSALQLVGSDFPVVKFIGGVLVTSWATNTKVQVQHPSDKPTIDQVMGGAAAYLPRSEVEHDRDALRHLHFYAYTKGGCDLAQIGRKD